MAQLPVGCAAVRTYVSPDLRLRPRTLAPDGAMDAWGEEEPDLGLEATTLGGLGGGASSPRPRRGSIVADTPLFDGSAAVPGFGSTAGAGSIFRPGSISPGGATASSTLPDHDVFADMLDDTADILAGAALSGMRGRRASVSGGLPADPSSAPTSPMQRDAPQLAQAVPGAGGAQGGRDSVSPPPGTEQPRMRRRSSTGSLSGLSGMLQRRGSLSRGNGGAAASPGGRGKGGRPEATGQREFECMYLGHAVASSPRGLDVARECAATVAQSDLAAQRVVLTVSAVAVDNVQPEMKRVVRRIPMSEVTFFCVHPDDKKVFVLIAHDRQHVTTCHCYRVKKEANKIVMAVSMERNAAKEQGALRDDRETPAVRFAHQQAAAVAEQRNVGAPVGRAGRRMSLTRAEMVTEERLLVACRVQLLGEQRLIVGKDDVDSMTRSCLAIADTVASPTDAVLSLLPDGLKLTDDTTSEILVNLSIAQIRTGMLLDGKSVLKRFKKAGDIHWSQPLLALITHDKSVSRTACLVIRPLPSTGADAAAVLAAVVDACQAAAKERSQAAADPFAVTVEAAATEMPPSLQHLLLDRSALAAGPVLGMGQFGAVHQARLTLPGDGQTRHVAVKVLRATSAVRDMVRIKRLLLAVSSCQPCAPRGRVCPTAASASLSSSHVLAALPCRCCRVR